MDHKLSPDTRLSLYRNVKTISEKDGPPVTVTLSGHLGAIRAGKYANGVNAVRVARGTAAYTQLKHQLPAVCLGRISTGRAQAIRPGRLDGPYIPGLGPARGRSQRRATGSRKGKVCPA